MLLINIAYLERFPEVVGIWGLKFVSVIRFELLDLSCLFNGWLQVIQAIQKLWAVVKYLHEGARFLLTRRLNQDTLEHFL